MANFPRIHDGSREPATVARQRTGSYSAAPSHIRSPAPKSRASGGSVSATRAPSPVARGSGRFQSAARAPSPKTRQSGGSPPAAGAVSPTAHARGGSPPRATMASPTARVGGGGSPSTVRTTLRNVHVGSPSIPMQASPGSAKSCASAFRTQWNVNPDQQQTVWEHHAEQMAAEIMQLTHARCGRTGRLPARDLPKLLMKAGHDTTTLADFAQWLSDCATKRRDLVDTSGLIDARTLPKATAEFLAAKFEEERRMQMQQVEERQSDVKWPCQLTIQVAQSLRDHADGTPEGVGDLFQRFDVDCSGQMDFETFEKVVRNELRMDHRTISDVKLREMFQIIDFDRGGTIEIHEIVRFARTGEYQALCQQAGITNVDDETYQQNQSCGFEPAFLARSLVQQSIVMELDEEAAVRRVRDQRQAAQNWQMAIETRDDCQSQLLQEIRKFEQEQEKSIEIAATAREQVETFTQEAHDAKALLVNFEDQMPALEEEVNALRAEVLRMGPYASNYRDMQIFHVFVQSEVEARLTKLSHAKDIGEAVEGFVTRLEGESDARGIDVKRSEMTTGGSDPAGAKVKADGAPVHGSAWEWPVGAGHGPDAGDEPEPQPTSRTPSPPRASHRSRRANDIGQRCSPDVHTQSPKSALEENITSPSTHEEFDGFRPGVASGTFGNQLGLCHNQAPIHDVQGQPEHVCEHGGTKRESEPTLLEFIGSHMDSDDFDADGADGSVERGPDNQETIGA